MDAHPVSQYITDTDGKWRLCAGVAVFNSKNEILIGERIGTSTWQTAQGGVDVGETVLEASKREMYEEVGLEFGKHVIIGSNSDDNTATTSCKYKTEGTGSWLEKQGFAGQQLLKIMIDRCHALFYFYFIFVFIYLYYRHSECCGVCCVEALCNIGVCCVVAFVYSFTLPIYLFPIEASTGSVVCSWHYWIITIDILPIFFPQYHPAFLIALIT